MSKPAIIEGEIEAPKANKIAKRKIEALPAPLQNGQDQWLATIERLAPAIGVEGVKELMAMRREERALENEGRFNTSMAECQSELLPVTRNARNDHTRSNYADLAALASAAMPVTHRHGFGLSFFEFEPKKPGHVGVGCKVMHVGGHSERYQFEVPLGGTGLKGNANMTDTHAYGSALTYGRRYAECAIFNIATRDDDGNAAGSMPAKVVERITEKQAAELKAKIQKTPEPAATAKIILQFWKVSDVSELTPTQYAKTVAQLKDKHGV